MSDLGDPVFVVFCVTHLDAAILLESARFGYRGFIGQEFTPKDLSAAMVLYHDRVMQRKAFKWYGRAA